MHYLIFLAGMVVGLLIMFFIAKRRFNALLDVMDKEVGLLISGVAIRIVSESNYLQLMGNDTAYRDLLTEADTVKQDIMKHIDINNIDLKDIDLKDISDNIEQ